MQQIPCRKMTTSLQLDNAFENKILFISRNSRYPAKYTLPLNRSKYPGAPASVLHQMRCCTEQTLAQIMPDDHAGFTVDGPNPPEQITFDTYNKWLRDINSSVSAFLPYAFNWYQAQSPGA